MNHSMKTLRRAALITAWVATGSVSAGEFPTTPPAPGPAPTLAVPTPSAQTLPNGLQVISVRRAGLPLVTAQLVLRSGSEMDPAHLAGLTDITANLLSKGAAGMSAPQIAAAAEALGGSLNIRAGWERQGWALLDRAAGQVMELRSDWFAKELLPGWYEDWVIIERERLGQLQIRFLEALVHHLRERGELARAIDHAMRLVAIDPLREHSQLALIHALLDEGSWGRARWQAEQYCGLLDSAFGVHASSAFMTEYRTLLPFEQVLSQ